MAREEDQNYIILSGNKLSGETKISIPTLEVIAFIAVKKVKGVYNLYFSGKGHFERFFSTNKFNQTKGIFINKKSDGSIALSIYVSLFFGVNIPKVSLQIQNSVYSAISSMTDLKISNIDINVINLKEETSSTNKKNKVDPNNLFKD